MTRCPASLALPAALLLLLLTPPARAACPGNVDGVGGVDADDLLAVINAWGPCPGCVEDLDGSGVVDTDDLLAVINNWGDCPAPVAGIIFVSQVPTDAGEFQISDVHGSFLGDNPVRDQPVGGNLYRLDPGATTPINLTNLPDAAVRNPEISWDGCRVIFSMKIGVMSNWQIYEMNVDGTGLRQVASTPSNETEPVYLPDGRILFASDRLGMLDAYENFPTGQLWIMNADGTEPSLLTTDPGGDTTPTIMESGEILFTRWQATIKDPCRAQALPISFSDLDVSRFLLWAIRPDGDSDAHTLYGAHTIQDFFGGYMQARPLRDGTGRLVVNIATAETWGAGGIAIIDPQDDITTNGQPEPTFITSELDYVDVGGVPPSGGRYRDPYPLAGGGFAVSFAPGQVTNQSFSDPGAPPPNFGLYTLGLDGTRTPLYDDPTMWEIEPVEVAARTTPPVLPPTLDRTDPSGVLNTMDVTLRDFATGSINPDIQGPVAPNEAEWVYLFKGVPSQYVYPWFHGYRQVQPALLGRAPVLADGSFAARIPADVPIIWKLVGQQGQILVEERFWTAVRPGQLVSCAGCHSPHDGSVGSTSNLALASPSALADLAAFDATRLIPGTPASVASRAQWATDQPRELDAVGIPIPELFGVDGESRSDRDQVAGQVTFEVGLCFNVDDPRLFGPNASTNTDLAEVRLVSPSLRSPTSPQELVEAAALADAISALGVRVTENGTQLRAGGTITGQQCTSLLWFAVPNDTTRTLRVIAVDSNGVETTASLALRCETAVPAPTGYPNEREDPLYAGQGAYLVQGGCDEGEGGALVEVSEFAELTLSGGTYAGPAIFEIAGDDTVFCNGTYTVTQVATLNDCAECTVAFEFVRSAWMPGTNSNGACEAAGPPWISAPNGTTFRWGWNLAEETLYANDGTGWEPVGLAFLEGGTLVVERLTESQFDADP